VRLAPLHVNVGGNGGTAEAVAAVDCNGLATNSGKHIARNPMEEGTHTSSAFFFPLALPPFPNPQESRAIPTIKDGCTYVCFAKKGNDRWCEQLTL